VEKKFNIFIVKEEEGVNLYCGEVKDPLPRYTESAGGPHSTQLPRVGQPCLIRLEFFPGNINWLVFVM
jgi:hypothetical protein